MPAEDEAAEESFEAREELVEERADRYSEIHGDDEPAQKGTGSLLDRLGNLLRGRK